MGAALAAAGRGSGPPPPRGDGQWARLPRVAGRGVGAGQWARAEGRGGAGRARAGPGRAAAGDSGHGAAADGAALPPPQPPAAPSASLPPARRRPGPTAAVGAAAAGAAGAGAGVAAGGGLVRPGRAAPAPQAVAAAGRRGTLRQVAGRGRAHLRGLLVDGQRGAAGRGRGQRGVQGGDVVLPPASRRPPGARCPPQRRPLHQAGPGALLLQPPAAPRVRRHPPRPGGPGPAAGLPRGGRALPGGLPDHGGGALPGLRLRAGGRRQPGAGAQGHAAGRHAGGREGAVHRPAGPLRRRHPHAGDPAAHRRVHAPQLRLQLGARGPEGHAGPGAGLRERGPQRRALRPRPARLQLRRGAPRALGQVQQAGADGRLLRGLQDHQRGGHPEPGPGRAGRCRQAHPGVRRADLLHGLHPRGPAPRERAGAQGPRRQSPARPPRPRPLRVPQRKGPDSTVPALESHHPARRRGHEDALGRAGRQGLLPLLRDPHAAAHPHGAAGAGQRAHAGGDGLHAGHGQAPLRAHHARAARPAPAHAARLPQHQHRAQHQRGPGGPRRPLLPHGQERGEELQPAQRAEVLRPPRQQRLPLAQGSVGEPQIRGCPQAGDHLHEADGLRPPPPRLLGPAGPERADLRVPPGLAPRPSLLQPRGGGPGLAPAPADPPPQ